MPRLLFAAAAAALCPLLLYIMEEPALLLTPARIILPYLLVYYVFRPRHLREAFSCYLVFYLSSLALGGLALLFSAGQKLSFQGGEAFILPPPSLSRLLAAASLLYLGMRWLEPLLREKLHFYLSPSALAMELIFNGRGKRLTAFVDTGNTLACPFTGTPTAVAAYDAVKEFLPQEVCAYLESKNGGTDWLNLEKILSLEKNMQKFCIIPYHSLHERGFLLAFRPDRVRLNIDGEDKEIKLLVAVQRAGRPRAAYDVLLPLETWRENQRNDERNIA